MKTLQIIGAIGMVSATIMIVHTINSQNNDENLNDSQKNALKYQKMYSLSLFTLVASSLAITLP